MANVATIWQDSRRTLRHDSSATHLGAEPLIAPALALHCARWCIDSGGQWKKQLGSNKYLFSVKALSKVFRAKYVQQLRENDITDKVFLESLFQKDWVVYAKLPFGGAK